MNRVVLDKGRRNVLQVSLGNDVSQDQFASEIRVDKDSESELLVAWTVSFLTDGTDGELLLTMNSAATSSLEKTTGYMDIKRVSAGEPVSVFNSPLQVLFITPVTA